MDPLRRAGFALAGALTLVAPFVVASCSSADDGAPGLESQSEGEAGGGGVTVDAGAVNACATPSQGCSCDSIGATVECGFVHQTSGTYVACSEGNRTCGADHTWGACIGDRVGDPAAPGRGFVLDNLQLDAGACIDAGPCDPSCQSFVDTASGVDAGPDSGLVWNEAGVSLSPYIPDSGPPCTGLTLSPATQTITVTRLPKSTDVPATSPTINYSVGQQYSVSLAPSTCFNGTVVPALYTINRYDIATMGASTGNLALVVGQATPTASPLTVSAYAGLLPVATATANVVVKVLDTSAAGTYSATNFPASTGTAEATGVQILYPLTGTMFPVGLPAPLVQWSNTDTSNVVHAANAVKITLRYPDVNPIFTWSAITQTESPPSSTLSLIKNASSSLHASPRYEIDPYVWSAFEQTAKGNPAASPASISVQRMIGTSGSTTPQAEMKVTFRFANGQLKGSVYYNSYGTNLVYNYSSTYSGAPFGAATLQVPIGQLQPTLIAGSSGCRVCHSVAAAGNRLITQQDTSSDRVSSMFDLTVSPAVETTVASNNDGRLSWPAIDPTGTYLFTNSSPASGAPSSTTYSDLYYVTSGVRLTGSNVPANLRAALPAFSPDGTEVAFNWYSKDQKSLAILDFNATTVKFTSSTPRILDTPTTYPDYYPSFFLNSTGATAAGVVFERELASDTRTFAATCSTCDQRGPAACQNIGAQGELWWSSIDSTPQVAKLTNANGVGLPTMSATQHTNDAIVNFEPTVLPQIVGGYAWMVFTSRRLFGNVATINPYWSDPRYEDLSIEPTPKKLWVAAIDPTTAEGSDPSFSAFYLPGQELLAGNSRGYWVLNACEPPGVLPANQCTSDLDCCNAPALARCVAASSTPPITKYCTAIPSTTTCAADGASCSIVGCCGALSGSQCVANVCQPPPSLVTYSGASFTRDYSPTNCGAGQTPVWRFLGWQSYTPGGSQIVFTVQTANSAAGIVSTSSPTPVQIATAKSNAAWSNPDQTPGWVVSPQTVDYDLSLVGQTSLPFLRLTANLQPGASSGTSPVLQDWRVTYDCIANQ